MTSEEMFRSELLARFARLEAHLQILNAEFREVKALLGTSQLAAQPASPPALIPAPPSAAAVPAAASPPAPAPVAVNGVAAPVPPPVAVAAPVIPAAPPVPDDPRVRKSRKRGWLIARIEQLVAESGPTFSFNTIFDAYEATWGWKSYPRKAALSATLWKVVRKHGHRVVTPGGGRRATLYQKASAA